MMSLVTWIIVLVAAVAATVLTATTNQAETHLMVTGAVALVLVGLAVRDNWTIIGSGAPKSQVASATARHCGIAWAWGALSILLIYVLVIEARWPEWWQFFLGFGAAALGSFGFSSLLDRDVAKGKDDPALIKMGRGLIIGQIVGVIAALISMFVDNKFPRPISFADWAGCNIFFFGGLAILLISLNALRSARE
ncbi:MAG: hypothetical protein CTY31_11870 [Hyphomicrobium sp.]|nr:MAG: hypothetical protein CTY39_09815 [Hyphomicrobium sp.]PPC98725.1 MAG: hypothetical protein CTY31_11870 [Hyphomicrobium sp.]